MGGELYHVYPTLETKENESLKVKLQIEDKVITMAVDSGACKSVIHIDDYNRMLWHLSLKPVSFKLKGVTGENVIIVGQILVRATYNDKRLKLPLSVLNSKAKFISLLDRNWLSNFSSNWRSIISSKIIDTKNINKICHFQDESSHIF